MVSEPAAHEQTLAVTVGNGTGCLAWCCAVAGQRYIGAASFGSNLGEEYVGMATKSTHPTLALKSLCFWIQGAHCQGYSSYRWSPSACQDPQVQPGGGCSTSVRTGTTRFQPLLSEGFMGLEFSLNSEKLVHLCQNIGETVSLVDVDISQRGLSSPHPPTPPPPPRRSLSLLDAFPRIAPIRAAESLHSQPPQHLQCPLDRQDSSSFTASLRELEQCGWYWGPMNWEDAEMKLKGKPDGSFLVRDSSDPRYILSLSFRSQGITHHTRMEHYRGTFSLWCHPKFEDRCQSVVEFIKRAIMHSKNGKFLYFLRSRVPGLPPTPVQLLYPVSRFSNVKSLQHLCRFRIRQLVRIDHIPDLPLPKYGGAGPLISYIRKFYYYDPQEEVYLSLKEAQLISKQKQEVEPST
ncbi:Suppressor of cytokine signaling 6 [Fukomys damarensis]|uniref:Suppressor of cytokine signaling 7 n=1 Tax=Fukomys damarensis TaxID=885580 RepID=A0A091DX83_FUKDA|nr:Suppressor of cytokine signaling 6 [Fukomys damarensis]